jgi:hypothetical protein
MGQSGEGVADAVETHADSTQQVTAISKLRLRAL